MPKHYRIVALALGLGLLLALLIIIFIPEEIPGGSTFFPKNTDKKTVDTTGTDEELLQQVTEEMDAIEQEYNFNAEPNPEDLESPSFTVDSTAEAQ